MKNLLAAFWPFRAENKETHVYQQFIEHTASFRQTRGSHHKYISKKSTLKPLQKYFVSEI